MGGELATVHDGRVLLATRIIAGLILPFLLAGFVLLYVFPGDTKELFAWTITPTMTSMFLASAYLGGQGHCKVVWWRAFGVTRRWGCRSRAGTAGAGIVVGA
jgi:hypothetical protein